MIAGLGLRDCLVGVSHECDFPKSVSQLPRVTRSFIPSNATSFEIDTMVRDRLRADRALYSLDIDALVALCPDLIVTQALCDVCAVADHEVNMAIDALSHRPAVVNLAPVCLADIFHGMRTIGQQVDRRREADDYVASLEERVNVVARRSQHVRNRPAVMLLEWMDPPFSAGHWNPELVEIAGGREVVGVARQRSVSTTWHQIAETDPEVMIIACCGFDLARARHDLAKFEASPSWQKLRCVRAKHAYLVDGSAYFNRPGPRIVDSLEILANALHPQLHPLPDGIPHAINLATMHR